jgi:DNA-directed RNA polymerase specialized sigma24 family protein
LQRRPDQARAEAVSAKMPMHIVTRSRTGLDRKTMGLGIKTGGVETIVDFGCAQTIIEVREGRDKMFGTKRVTPSQSSRYAAGADFCKIFSTDMNHLYLLAFLLTADRSAAERCFVEGLEDARDGSPVFKEWAHSWARRLLIVNAIRMVRPRPENLTAAASRHAIDATGLPPAIAAILSLSDFERFAFAMSVLEGYSDRECSLLLECSVADLIAARTRALQQTGSSTEFRHEVAQIESGDLPLPYDLRAPVTAATDSQMAASA